MVVMMLMSSVVCRPCLDAQLIRGNVLAGHGWWIFGLRGYQFGLCCGSLHSAGPYVH